MEPLNHQMMGYDRAVSMFSPDGRLLQVEYAKKTVKQGSTAIGLVCNDAVVLVAQKRLPGKLIISSSVEKIYQIDEHLMATFAGITSDARVLVERSQVKAQQNKISYDTPVDVISIVKEISDLKQYTTQSGGLRPFGVSLILAGIDVDGPKVYITDPTGIYFRYNAVAIGADEAKATEYLEKEFKENLSVDNGIKLAINAIKSCSEEDLESDKLEVAVIEKDNTYNKLSSEEIQKFLK